MPRKTLLTQTFTAARSRFNEAAARCRGKPTSAPRLRPGRPRFNEAAARCRGKRKRSQTIPAGDQAASMRPRPDAAENVPPKALFHPRQAGLQ